MIKLAREGKEITKIMKEDFPDYNYWDIYCEIYGAGERSVLGVKRMITNRLNKLTALPANEQQEIIEEIDNLVCHLYSRFKESQEKLDEIRAVSSADPLWIRYLAKNMQGR